MSHKRVGSLLGCLLCCVIALAPVSQAFGQQSSPTPDGQEQMSPDQSMQHSHGSQSDRQVQDHPPTHPDHEKHQGHDMHHSKDAQNGSSDAPSTEPGQQSPKETSSESQHVAPDPPQHPMPAMPYKEMATMMQMNDKGRVGRVLLDEFEWRNTDAGNAAMWYVQGWYGGDYNKLWIKTEGERVRGSTEDARVDVLWDRIVSRWWSVQGGVRQDFGEGPSRTWAALGVQGLAPYWFDTEATFYVGEQGRTAARLRTEYDLLLTQRLILQPEAEANLYGKSDPARRIGSGLSDVELAVRLRYEIRREFAPYVGLAWTHRFAGTADLVRAAGEHASDLQVVAGVRAWF